MRALFSSQCNCLENTGMYTSHFSFNPVKIYNLTVSAHACECVTLNFLNLAIGIAFNIQVHWSAVTTYRTKVNLCNRCLLWYSLWIGFRLSLYKFVTVCLAWFQLLMFFTVSRCCSSWNQHWQWSAGDYFSQDN